MRKKMCWSGVAWLPVWSSPLPVRNFFQKYFLAHGPSLIPSLGAQTVKNLPAIQETQVQSLGWEDPLEKGMVTHSSILSWRIPWTEEPGGLQPTESERVGHDWEMNTLSCLPTQASLWQISKIGAIVPSMSVCVIFTIWFCDSSIKRQTLFLFS